MICDFTAVVAAVALTDAMVGDSFADASLEETAASVATVDTVMLAERLVATDLAVHGNRKSPTHDLDSCLVVYRCFGSRVRGASDLIPGLEAGLL